MRALVCTGYGNGENLTLASRPTPEPGAGEVRVRVLACGANASDWEFVTGTPLYGRISRWFLRKDVFGSDVLGEVAALGPGCGRLRLGQRVRHQRFGEGIVLNLEGSGSHARVQVNFPQAGSKWLVVAYANLEPL